MCGWWGGRCERGDTLIQIIMITPPAPFPLSYDGPTTVLPRSRPKKNWLTHTDGKPSRGEIQKKTHYKTMNNICDHNITKIITTHTHAPPPPHPTTQQQPPGGRGVGTHRTRTHTSSIGKSINFCAAFILIFPRCILIIYNIYMPFLPLVAECVVSFSNRRFKLVAISHIHILINSEHYQERGARVRRSWRPPHRYPTRGIHSSKHAKKGAHTQQAVSPCDGSTRGGARFTPCLYAWGAPFFINWVVVDILLE